MEITDRPRKRYLIEDFKLEPEKQLLQRGDQPVHLPKRPFQVLHYLIEHRDRYVSRAELLDLFWEGREVYDDALRKCVGTIRKTLDDPPDKPRFVETRWGVGYRYIGPVEEQVVHDEREIVEIEKTRGLRIVVEEEEEVQDEPPIAENAATNPTNVPRISPSPSLRKRLRIVALGLVLLTLGITAVVFENTREIDRQRLVTAEFHPAAVRSIAVLPLRNLSGDPASEYFSDGITDNLISTLSRIEGLKVVSRGSVFTYKGKDVDPHTVREKLGVDALLEGSVLVSGEALRVNVRLVSTEDGRVLWGSNSYDRSISDILGIQDDIARNIATELKIKLNGEDQQRLAKRYTENIEAYQSYLKGTYFLNKRTPEGITRGIEYFKRAIEIDPNYALAYSELAEGYDKALWYMELRPQEMIEKEKAAASRALELDDSLSEAHVAMATVYANEWKLASAAREEERAIEINPGNAVAHHNYAYRLIDLLRPDEAIVEIKRARELDPLNVVMNVDVGEILLFARRYDEAIAALHEALEMEQDRANAHLDLAMAYDLKRMDSEAVAEYLTAITLSGKSADAVALKNAYEAGGIESYWRERLKQLKSNAGHTQSSEMAIIYTKLGDKDQAFAWLEKAYQERSPTLVGLESSPIIDSLRSDPRYEDLLRRVGLPRKGDAGEA
jgi:TolB-like protein/DNA-binding winged helix-turn-helix (wHTH) protein/Tfp pilus assembly protein PilF